MVFIEKYKFNTIYTSLNYLVVLKNIFILKNTLFLERARLSKLVKTSVVFLKLAKFKKKFDIYDRTITVLVTPRLKVICLIYFVFKIYNGILT